MTRSCKVARRKLGLLELATNLDNVSGASLVMARDKVLIVEAIAKKA